MSRTGVRACDPGWVGLIDILLCSLLLLDFQDCRLSDLLPSLKQPMEAPLQTGMVRVGEFVHRTTTPGGLAIRRGILSSRTMNVQAKLRFPACIAGYPASGNVSAASPVEVGREPALTHSADGDTESRAEYDLLWGRGDSKGPGGGLGETDMRCPACAVRSAGAGRDDRGRSGGAGHRCAHPLGGAEATGAE